jgi:hypothetical protein
MKHIKSKLKEISIEGIVTQAFSSVKVNGNEVKFRTFFLKTGEDQTYLCVCYGKPFIGPFSDRIIRKDDGLFVKGKLVPKDTKNTFKYPAVVVDRFYDLEVAEEITDGESHAV